MTTRVLPAPLALYLGALGLAGGTITADHYQLGALGMDGDSRRIVMVGTPLVSAAVGAFLTKKAIDGSAGRSAFVTLSALVVAGAAVGLAAWSGFGPLIAMGSGIMTAVAFLPAVALVVWSARRIGRARPGSLIDRSDRRTVGLVTAAPIVFGSIAAFPRWHIFSQRIAVDGSFAVIALALAAVVVISVSEVAAFARVHRIAIDLAWMMPGSGEASRNADVTDLGIGDQVFDLRPSGQSAYRDADVALRRVIGDVNATRSALRRNMIGAIVLLVASIAALAFALWLAADRAAPAELHSTCQRLPQSPS
jgi:hypothetical protein